MSATSMSPASVGPAAEQQARLEGGERDRSYSAQRPSPVEHLAGQARQPRRDIDGQDGRPARLRRRVGPFQAGPVGGVDHQIGRRQGRTPAQVGRLEHVHLGSVAGQQLGRQPTVGAVIALAGHDRDLLAVGAVEQASGVGEPQPRRPGRRARRPAPAPAGLRRPSPRGQDGDHASATTTAAAVLDVCVKETIHERTWRSEASRAASPESTR